LRRLGLVVVEAPLRRTDMNVQTSDNIPVGWGLFAAKMALGLVWIAVAMGGAILLDQTSLLLRLIGAVLVAAPAFVWLGLLQRQSQRDELEARHAVNALAQGGWWAVAFGAMFYALQSFSGATPPTHLLPILPTLAFLFGESMAQVSRWQMTRGRP
jgi:hypothetical protein